MKKDQAINRVLYHVIDRPAEVKTDARWHGMLLHLQRELLIDILPTPKTIKVETYGAGTRWHCIECDEGVSHFTNRPTIFYTNSPPPAKCPKCGGGRIN